jgi:hypothetical protein
MPTQPHQPGKAQLKSLGITHIFDLRSDPEMAKWHSPIPRIDGVEVIHAPVFKNEDYSPEMMAKSVLLMSPTTPCSQVNSQEIQIVFCEQNGRALQTNPRSYSITTEKQAYRLSCNSTRRYWTMLACHSAPSFTILEITRTLVACFIVPLGRIGPEFWRRSY